MGAETPVQVPLLWWWLLFHDGGQNIKCTQKRGEKDALFNVVEASSRCCSVNPGDTGCTS